MKKILFILTFFVCVGVSAQQYFFNGTVYVPKTTTEINAISSPAEGRLEYNSTTESMWLYDGSSWVDTGSSGASQTLAEVLTEGNTANNHIDMEANNVDDINIATFRRQDTGTETSSIRVPDADRWYLTKSASSLGAIFDLGNIASSSKVFELPNASGTIALTSDIGASGDLLAANNLSDLDNASTALTNLGLTATSTELNYTDGVTSNIQTQINNIEVGGIVASGTFALTTSSTNTITHGLGYAPDPSRILVTAYRTGTVSAVSATMAVGNITSTTFDVPVGSFSDPLSASWAIFGSDNATPMTGGEIVTSIDTELGSTDWQSGGSSFPVDADEAIIQDETDNTKQVDFDLSEITTSTKRTVTIPDAPVDLGDISNKVDNTISGRTGTTVTSVMQQTQSQLTSDGEPSAGEIVFCSDCDPAETVDATTLDVDNYKAYDDRSTDAATFTFSNLKVGATVMIEINRATDATYSGVTVAYDEGTFAANTRQLVTIFILPSGDVWRKYKTIE